MQTKKITKIFIKKEETMKRHVKEFKGKLVVFLVIIFIMVLGIFSKVILNDDFLEISGGGLIDQIEHDSIIDNIKT